jgi:hypothetical protein
MPDSHEHANLNTKKQPRIHEETQSVTQRILILELNFLILELNFHGLSAHKGRAFF